MADEEHGRSGEVASASELRWNPLCVLCGPGERPPSLDRVDEWSGGFAWEGETTAWVEDAGTGQWRPFWLNQKLVSRLAEWKEQGSIPVDCDPELAEQLCRAGILTRAGDTAFARQQWAAVVERGRKRFAERGYLAISGLLHPYHLGELRRYYRQLIRRGRVALGDYQSSRRYVAHNEPVARFFHLQLTDAVTDVVGEPVQPSYVYFASYHGGATLKRHTDRKQCEFSITLCLDYAPEPADATPWPLHLDTPKGRVTVKQALGDALLYRGRKLPHYRDCLPDGHTSTSIFFHYVSTKFSGSLS